MNDHTEYGRQKRQWENKAHHLSLDGVNSLCGIEKTYKGGGQLKLIDPLTLPSLVNGRPEKLPGVTFHKGVCAKCWRKLMPIFSPDAEKAAREAVETRVTSERTSGVIITNQKGSS